MNDCNCPAVICLKDEYLSGNSCQPCKNNPDAHDIEKCPWTTKFFALNLNPKLKPKRQKMESIFSKDKNRRILKEEKCTCENLFAVGLDLAIDLV